MFALCLCVFVSLCLCVFVAICLLSRRRRDQNPFNPFRPFYHPIALRRRRASAKVAKLPQQRSQSLGLANHQAQLLNARLCSKLVLRSPCIATQFTHVNPNVAMIYRYLYPLFSRKRFYASVVFFGFLAYTYDTVEMRLTDETMMRKLAENAFAYVPKVTHFRQWGREMRYVQVGDAHKPLILFIHGAPSSSSFWMDMLSDSSLLSQAKLLAVDRPGYGYSGYGDPETSVKRQAALIAGILQEKRAIHRQIIVHGSSYGGTVAARLAMDYPELVDGLLLQSASLKPGAETTYWISYPTHHWSMRNFIPGSIRTANAEKLSHKAELEKMVPLWPRIRSKVILLQGIDDTLIFPENAPFAAKNLVNAASVSLTLVPGSKHDLLWTQTDLLKRSLLKLIQITKK